MAVEKEIGAGNRRRIQKKKRPARNRFGKDRKKAFLARFATTCNTAESARAAGVPISTVYTCRMADPEFRAQYAAALEQGYAMLEAEMVRRATAAAKSGFQPDRDSEAALASMDPKMALQLLQMHGRNKELGLGNSRPRRSDIEQARARLEKRMRALGLLPRPTDGKVAPTPALPVNRGDDE